MKLSKVILFLVGVVAALCIYCLVIYNLGMYVYNRIEFTPPQIVKVEVPTPKPTILALKPSYEELRDMTVVISGTTIEWDEDVEAMRETSWMGTGIILYETDVNTYILTNKHVAPQKVGVYISVEDDSPNILVKAEVIANSELYDLALIKISHELYKKHQFYGLARSVEVGEMLYVVGHHLGRRFIYGEGVFAGWDAAIGIVQIPILFGNSGSGVFNARKELVGLIYAGSIFPMGPFSIGFDVAHGLFVPVEAIRVFLRENLNIYVD
jgi:S1-C subfamily serine protease